MQSRVGWDDAAEVVVEEGKNVMAYFRPYCFGDGAGPFEFVTRVGPEIQVRVFVLAVFFAGEEAGVWGRGVEVAGG